VSAWLIGALIYLGGAILTGIFNVAILMFISSPLAIVRNAILWPRSCCRI
jgi:hypothetical protein